MTKMITEIYIILQTTTSSYFRIKLYIKDRSIEMFYTYMGNELMYIQTPS